MKLLLLLTIAALLSGCASRDCYTATDLDTVYTYGYQVGRASLLRCPECPEQHGSTHMSDALKEAARATKAALADEIEKLETDTDTEWGHIKALYR